MPRVDVYEAVFAALAHDARRRVLLTIFFNGGSMSAGEIPAIFAHAWQTTTRHLQVLEAAGLLSHEQQGRMRIYRIQRKRLELVNDWLAHFRGFGSSKGESIMSTHQHRDKEGTVVTAKSIASDVPQFFRLNVEVG